MTGLDYFTFIVLAVLIGVGIWIAIVLGGLPGKIAEQRGHPQAEAIRVAGWLGLLTLGVLWPFALIWAFVAKGPVTDRAAALQESIDRLSDRVDRLERSAGDAQGRADS